MLMREKLRNSPGMQGKNSLTGLIVNFINSMLRHSSAELMTSGDRRPIAWLDFVRTHLEEKFGVPLDHKDEKELMIMDLAPVLSSFCEKMEINIEYISPPPL